MWENAQLSHILSNFNCQLVRVQLCLPRGRPRRAKRGAVINCGSAIRWKRIKISHCIENYVYQFNFEKMSLEVIFTLCTIFIIPIKEIPNLPKLISSKDFLCLLKSLNSNSICWCHKSIFQLNFKKLRRLFYLTM